MTKQILSGLPPAPFLQRSCSGLLFVGDPHLSCVTPGRRIEEDFLQVVLDKLRQAREIAERENLFIIFTGDLTENSTVKKEGTNKIVENPNLMLPGFAEAMNFRESITLRGNHDAEEVTLTPDATLMAMKRLGLVHVIEPSGPYAIFDIDGMSIGLGGTSYGEKIPVDVRGAFNQSLDKVVWITHTMFNFDLKIPGLTDPPEIIGCDVAVNGHDHTTQKPRQIGQTEWFNPGNITRMKVDCVNHVPSVWQWHPVTGMKQHVLQYNKNVFDMTGLQVEPDAKAALRAEQKKASLFSSLLSIEQQGDMARTSSGDLLDNDIDLVIAQQMAKGKMSEAAALMIKNLHKRAPEKIKTT